MKMKYANLDLGIWLLFLSYTTALYIPNVQGTNVQIAGAEVSWLAKLFSGQLGHQDVLNIKPTPQILKITTDVTSSSAADDFKFWLAKQSQFAFKGVLNNIGGISDVLDTNEVSKGAVIAATSKSFPNYYYQWVRDAALTIKVLVEKAEDSELQNVDDIKLVVESYIENAYYIQRLDNKSGRFDDDDKSGLGEPKFLTNNKPFDDHWGRPQGDGPGLRALTIIKYLQVLHKFDQHVSNDFLKSEEFIYTQVLKPDLQFIAKNWMKKSFDLWEEVNSFHFFTSITQLKAIKEGLKVAKIYDSNKSFLEELETTFAELKNFIENESGFTQKHSTYMIETPSLLKSGQRCGLDVATLLGALHAHEDSKFNDSDIPFDIFDGHILSSLSYMVSDVKNRYPINQEGSEGVGIGRYPEDIYDGYGTSEGNPWFLATASAAEVIYKLISKLESKQENLIIDSSNFDFYGQFLTQQTDEVTYGTAEFNSLIHRLYAYADSFIQVIRTHVDGDGHTSEQFNKYNGYMQGAQNLTWSYASTWSAIRWREKASTYL